VADTTADLISELLTDHGVTLVADERIYGGVVPRGVACPFLWIRREATRASEALEDEAEPLYEDLAVECVALDSIQANELADAVRAWARAWNAGGSAVLGDHTYSFVAVTDAADDYVPRNIDAGENLFIVSLSLEVTRP
jgi:hypothetical protein